MRKTTKIKYFEFKDVLGVNRGSKTEFKLPSYIDNIKNIGLYISNPVDFTSEDLYSNVIKYLFNAVEVSILLFNQNNTILDFQLISNNFVEVISLYTRGVPDYRIDYNFSLRKIFVPINKKNIRNVKSTIIFKETEMFYEKKKDLSLPFTNWKPNVILYIEHD